MDGIQCLFQFTNFINKIVSIFLNGSSQFYKKYQGRPHWGKLHSMQAAQLRELYPKWDDFMQLREQLDPQQKWMNSHLTELFLAS